MAEETEASGPRWNTRSLILYGSAYVAAIAVSKPIYSDNGISPF
jgi:hypothetical protein